nr:methylesterase 1-like [Arachis hypogaea]
MNMEKEKESNKKRRHFVLVHGACHGGWCWYKVSALLKSGGHKVTAPDMAASGIHPKKVQDLASITEYVEPLIELLESLPSESEERVILVGHSFGGICISMAMELFPKKIAAAVFLSAFMPSPDRGFLTLYRGDNNCPLLIPSFIIQILFLHHPISPQIHMIIICTRDLQCQQ